MRKRLLSPGLFVLALLAAAPARADKGTAGAQPFSFLGLDSSARAAAMGGAYTALAADADALQYNPAGLGLLRENGVSFMHNLYFESATQDHLGLALRPGFGLSADVLNYGRLTRTTYASPDGTLGQFSIADTALSAGYGRAFGSLSLGAAAKLLREKNDGFVGQTEAADVGALWVIPGGRGLRLGAAAQNLGGKVRFQSDRETLPTTGRAGAAWSFAAFGHENVVSVDAVKEGTDKAILSAGAETVAGGSLALRLGYTTRNAAGLGLSAGVGWRGERWSIDYAIAPYGDLGLTHRVGVGLRWGLPEEHEEQLDPVILEALRSRPREEPAEKAAAAPLEAEIAAGEAPTGVTIPAADRIAKARRLIDAVRFDEARIELDAVDRTLGAEDRQRVGWYEAEGRLQRGKRNLPAARAAYTDSLRVAMKDGEGGQVVADAYEGMGLTLAEQGDLAYGVKFLRKAYQIRPAQRLLDQIENYERLLQK
jgi:hypothetical protein